VAKLHALVVDDSKVGRLTMQKRLEAAGMQVDMTESGQQALDYLAHRRPDLIFMDHMMPDMDGFEVTRRIKATPGIQDIPVIIASGNDEPEFVEQARAAGAVDAIAKPPPPGVLEALLARLPSAVTTAAPAVPAAAPAAVPMDQAAVQAVVERLLGSSLAPLRERLLAELDERIGSRLAAQQQTIEQWVRVESQHLDAAAAEMAALRHAVAEAGAGAQRLAALGQDMERRLTALETASPAVPEADGLHGYMQQFLTAGIDQLHGGLRADLERQQAQRWQELQAAVETRLREHAAQMEAHLAATERRLGEISAARAGEAVTPERLARLQARVKSLTLVLAIGGGLLLVAMGVLLLRVGL
jgi:CheY-like chemotaxis protein